MALPLFGASAEEPLAVTFDGDNLHVAAPGLHFLTGKPLSRLRDAATVAFVSQITLFSDDHGTIFHRPVQERLIVSYDLWEEKFAVTIRGTDFTRSTPRLLTLPQAESWCIENLAVSALGLAPDRPFWLRFELRAVDQKDLINVVGDTGLSIGSLIDLFSRRGGANDSYWRREAGPLRLIDLPRKSSGRGTPIG
ncbi:MAG TPA: hypothetical protein VGH38_01230 [Bryobacteraceae bacterium]